MIMLMLMLLFFVRLKTQMPNCCHQFHSVSRSTVATGLSSWLLALRRKETRGLLTWRWQSVKQNATLTAVACHVFYTLASNRIVSKVGSYLLIWFIHSSLYVAGDTQKCIVKLYSLSDKSLTSDHALINCANPRQMYI